MKTSTKILFLIIISFITLIFLTLYFQHVENQQKKLFVKSKQRSIEKLVDNAMKNIEERFVEIAKNYGLWDEMFKIEKNPDKASSQENINKFINLYSISYLWGFDSKMKLLYSGNDKTLLPFPNLTLTSEELALLFKNRNVNFFFVRKNYQIIQLFASHITTKIADKKDSIIDRYLFIGKVWDMSAVSEIESIAETKINIISDKNLNKPMQISESDDFISKVEFLFKDYDTKSSSKIRFSSAINIFDEWNDSTKSFLLVSIFISVFILLMLSITLNYWITIPLYNISKSLQTENLSYLNKTKQKKSEFGRIGLLIEEFFTQKQELKLKSIELSEMVEELRATNETIRELNIELQIRFNEIEKQKEEIEQQRDLLAFQKQEILDSIHYAKRIQTAMLPLDEYIYELLPHHFLFFKPRDVVSGDFYWVTPINSKTDSIEENQSIVAAVADCTGHGVPGAFMSMLGISFLNEIVDIYKHSKTNSLHANTILNKLRHLVKISLRQTEKHSSTKDGMDIALCIIDKKNMLLQYAGANNPVFIVRKQDETTENQIIETKHGIALLEYKGDRMPIGIHMKEKESFTNHEIKIQKNDIIYMFSDGFEDQFGGETGRKFLLKNLKHLFMSMFHKDMSEQKQTLESTLNSWMGNKYEQIDDILIMGIRI